MPVTGHVYKYFGTILWDSTAVLHSPRMICVSLKLLRLYFQRNSLNSWDNNSNLEFGRFGELRRNHGCCYHELEHWRFHAGNGWTALYVCIKMYNEHQYYWLNSCLSKINHDIKTDVTLPVTSHFFSIFYRRIDALWRSQHFDMVRNKYIHYEKKIYGLVKDNLSDELRGRQWKWQMLQIKYTLSRRY